MAGFLKKIASLFQGRKNPGPTSRSMDVLKEIMHSVDLTQDIEYDCSQVYELLDQYAEMVNRGEDASQIMPLVKQHLELCGDCYEEYEALLQILEAVS
jgi:hypothetical protein